MRHPSAQRPRLLVALAGLLSITACETGPMEYPAVGAIDGSEDEVVFEPGQVLTYHVTLSQADRDWIEEHGIDEQWRPATLTVTGGEQGTLDLGQVGFRHKGSWGTLDPCWTAATQADDPDTEEDEALLSRRRIYADFCARLSYKFRFDRYVKETTFHGLKKLNLHSGQRDPTKLHDMLAYSVFYEAGLQAPRTSPARLYINGDFMGMLIAVEEVDDRFAAYHYTGAEAGNLYKEVWPTPALAAAWGAERFASSLAAALETNTKEPDVSDFTGFTAAVAGATPDGFAEAMAPWIDLEELLRYMAVDRAIGNWDGLTALYRWCDETGCRATPHNFYWYHDSGSQGRFHLVPWDMDNTFQSFAPYLDPPDASTAERPVPGWNVKPADCAPIRVWADSHVVPPGCDAFLNLLAASHWSRYQQIGRQLAGGPLRYASLNKKVLAWSSLIEPILRDDPYVNMGEWLAARDQLQNQVLPAIGVELDALREAYVEQ